MTGEQRVALRSMSVSPSIILSGVISVFVALIYHVWRGGGFGRLVLSVVAAWLGFALGHLIGQLLGLNLILIGDLHVAEGLIVALIALVIVNRPD